MAKFSLLTILTLNAAGYTSGMQQASKQAEFLRNTMGGVTRTLGAFGIAGLSVGTVVAGLKKTIMATETTADRFEIAMSQAKVATDVFFKALSTGDWTKFLENFKEAARVGKEYAEALDVIGDRKRSVTLLTKEDQHDLGVLKESYRDLDNSLEVRTQKLQEYKDLLKTSFDRQIALSKTALDNELKLAGFQSGIASESIVNLIKYYDTYAVNIEKVYDVQKKVQELESKKTRAETALSGTIGPGKDILKKKISDYDTQITQLKGTLSPLENIISKNLAGFDKIIATERKVITTAIGDLYGLQTAYHDEILAIGRDDRRLSKEAKKNAADRIEAIKEEAAERKKAFEDLMKQRKAAIPEPLVGYNSPVVNYMPKASVVDNMQMDYSPAWKAAQKATDSANQSAIQYGNTIMAVGGFLGDLAGAAGSGFKGVVTIILRGISQLVSAYFTMACAGLAAKEISDNGIIGIAIAAAGIALLVSLWETFVPEFATGVQNYGGGLALVGERGSELVQLPAGSNVYNHSDTTRMLNGGNISGIGGGQVTFHIQGTELVGVLSNHGKKYGRLI
jgi:hypothetical protein